MIVAGFGRGNRAARLDRDVDTAGAREEHSLIGSPAEIASKLTALKAQGAAYVLLFGQGSRENMRRFAGTVMPAFAAS